jgi:hypothetical protein
MAGQQTAVCTALALEATAGEKGFAAARQSGVAQSGYGMGHQEFSGVGISGLQRLPLQPVSHPDCPDAAPDALVLQAGAST